MRQDSLRSTGGGRATARYDVEALMLPSDYDDDDDNDGSSSGGGGGGGGLAGNKNKTKVTLHLTKLPSTIASDAEFVFLNDKTFNPAMVKDLVLLASEPDVMNDDDSDGFALLSINLKSGLTRGLQRKKGGIVHQLSASNSTSPLHGRQLTAPKSDRKFTCGVDHAHSTRHGGTPENSQQTPSLRSGIQTIPKVGQALESTLASDASTFIINVLVAVDSEFIQKQGGTDSAVEYINWLMGATTAILEPEVGARLNVVKIEETDVFRGSTTLDEGLETMRKGFEGTVDKDGNVNLVHALLGRHIGGGIAYVGEFVTLISVP